MLALSAVAYGADGDQDNDTIPDSSDNCPSVHNPDQADRHGTGTVGDACDDPDKDGLSDRYELYTTYGSHPTPRKTNPDRKDTDGDGLSDGYEVNRTYGDPAAPRRSDPTVRDTDGDRWDDGTEVYTGTDPTKADTDDDGYQDSLDNCPKHSNSNQRDSDNDGRGDACDPPDCVVCPPNPDPEVDPNQIIDQGQAIFNQIAGMVDVRPASDMNKMGADGYVVKITQSSPAAFSLQVLKAGVAQPIALPHTTTYSYDGAVGAFVHHADQTPTEGSRIVMGWKYSSRAKVLYLKVGPKQVYENVAVTFSVPVVGYPTSGTECRAVVLPVKSTCDGFAVGFYHPGKNVNALDALDAVPFPITVRA